MEPNRFSQIPHQIIEAMAKVCLPSQEWQVLLVIWRQTFGWNRKTATISLREFAEKTGIARKNIPRVISRLVGKGLIKKSSLGDETLFSLEVRVEKWSSGTSTLASGGSLTGEDGGASAVRTGGSLTGEVKVSSPVRTEHTRNRLISSHVPEGEIKDTYLDIREIQGAARTVSSPVRLPPMDEIRKTFSQESGGTKNCFFFSQIAEAEITRAWNTLIEKGARDPLGAIKAVIAVAMREMIQKMDREGLSSPPIFYEPHVIFKEEHFARYLSMAKPPKRETA